MGTSPLFCPHLSYLSIFYDLFRVNFKVEFSMDLFYLFKDDNREFGYLIKELRDWELLIPEFLNPLIPKLMNS
jgi:hypothetical protein